MTGRAVDIIARRAAQVAQEREAREAVDAENWDPFVATPNDSGRACCAECKHRIMRTMQVGVTTIHIGKPDLRCGIDQSFRSPELKRDCRHFARNG